MVGMVGGLRLEVRGKKEVTGYEVVTLNEIFKRWKLFSEGEAAETRKRCEQIDRKLNGLINSLRGTQGRSFS